MTKTTSLACSALLTLLILAGCLDSGPPQRVGDAGAQYGVVDYYGSEHVGTGNNCGTTKYVSLSNDAPNAGQTGSSYRGTGSTRPQLVVGKYGVDHDDSKTWETLKHAADLRVPIKAEFYTYGHPGRDATNDAPYFCWAPNTAEYGGQAIFHVLFWDEKTQSYTEPW